MAGLNDLLNEGDSLKSPELGDAIGGGTNKELMAEARMALSGNWGMTIIGIILYSLMTFSIFLFMLVLVSVFSVGTAWTIVGPFLGIFGLYVAMFFVASALLVGKFSFFLNIAQEGDVQLDCLFTGFKRFWCSAGTYFLFMIIVMLWCIPLFALFVLLPVFNAPSWGVLIIMPLYALPYIAVFQLALSFFIVADDADAGPVSAIKTSTQAMKGNKWKLFCLFFRFFWWGLLFVGPYWVFGTAFAWAEIVPSLAVLKSLTYLFLAMAWMFAGSLYLYPYIMVSMAKFYEDVK